MTTQTSHNGSQDQQPILWSVNQAAKLLNISPLSLRRMAYRGDLRTVKIGRRRLVQASELNRIINKGLE